MADGGDGFDGCIEVVQRTRGDATASQTSQRAHRGVPSEHILSAHQGENVSRTRRELRPQAKSQWGENGAYPAEDRNERDHQQLPQIMPSVLGAGIRDVVEGGKEDVHGGDGLRRMSCPTQTPSRARQQEGQCRASKPTAIPLRLHGRPRPGPAAGGRALPPGRGARCHARGRAHHAGPDGSRPPGLRRGGAANRLSGRRASG